VTGTGVEPLPIAPPVSSHGVSCPYVSLVPYWNTHVLVSSSGLTLALNDTVTLFTVEPVFSITGAEGVVSNVSGAPVSCPYLFSSVRQYVYFVFAVNPVSFTDTPSLLVAVTTGVVWVFSPWHVPLVL